MLILQVKFANFEKIKFLQNSLISPPTHLLSGVQCRTVFTRRMTNVFNNPKILSKNASISLFDAIRKGRLLSCHLLSANPPVKYGSLWQLQRLKSSTFDVNPSSNISKDPNFVKLQNYANLNRADASIQAKYLKSVVDYDPEYVVRRFESGLYASDATCRRIYLDALNRISNSSRYDRIQIPIHQSYTPNPNLNPTVVEPPPRFGFLKKAGSRLVELLLICALGFVIYNSGVQFNMRFNNQEIHVFSPEPGSVTFRDVKGCSEPKEELMEVVEFLKNPTKFTRLGATIPKGILLIGPPGTGKTLLARAVAGEAGVPFFFCSGSEFDEVFVGLGASRIRKIFEAARAKTPCIIFIDELDALGGKRNSSDANYNRQTLNQFLVEMDGFKKDSNLIVIAATNLPESLDKALIRSAVSAELLANLTPGLSGADISNLVNQAAQHASIGDKNFVTLEDFDWAREKVAFGRERKSLLMTEHDKKITAYHEAGHAVTAFYTKNANKLHKATIIPRGSSLGTTQTLPERERLHETYEELQAHMDVCLGGRVAEEIIFGKNQITTGCTSDLTKATEIARAMVMMFGMNQQIGYISTDSKQISDATLALIDKEVKNILDKSYERVKQLLSTHSEQHKRLANELIKRETLVGDDLENAILGRSPNLSV